jgi:hypothetical protein
MTTTNKVEIFRNETVRMREDCHGRIRERNMIFWDVVKDGVFLYEGETLREAKAFVERHGLSATVIR